MKKGVATFPEKNSGSGRGSQSKICPQGDGFGVGGR